MILRVPPVYAITDRTASGVDDPARLSDRLLRVGVRALQLREKGMADRGLLAAADAIAAASRAAGALFLVNDRADVARLSGAGVHLGEDDLPVADARRLLGPEAPIGVSTHDPQAAARAFADRAADYVAFGPVYESPTKGVRPPRGLEALARVAAQKTRPLVAIGGITIDRLPEVWNAGADSAAMIGALYAGGRIEENARAALDAARRRGRPRRLYLVGFMGCGKSTIGRRLAERLGTPFVDLDDEIERTSGRTVRALFEESGEAGFRRLESQFLAATESLPAAVVATGGGCFTLEENRRAIGARGLAIFLDATLDSVHARLKGKTDRPLFVSEEQLAGLFAARAPFYRMAPVAVRLDSTETVEQSADRVLVALDEFETIPA